mmetsp:Transcript_6955/g.11461  ORF Transcript_6955/g.11461 Transcript_6955/m.11461 type:complete len:136 (-) Transcript_6955:621-1028(-)
MAHVRRGRKRIRAHANPFSEADVAVPLQPGDIDWKTHFDRKVPCRPNICDVGCGFGGLILALSSILPEDLVVGLEIRPQAVAIVEERLRKAREDGKASNVCVLRCNIPTSRSRTTDVELSTRSEFLPFCSNSPIT